MIKERWRFAPTPNFLGRARREKIEVNLSISQLTTLLGRYCLLFVSRRRSGVCRIAYTPLVHAIMAAYTSVRYNGCNSLKPPPPTQIPPP